MGSARRTPVEAGYTTDGQLTAILVPSKSTFMSYDALNRLTDVTQGTPPSAGGVPVPVEDYSCDAEGNRTASSLSSFYTSNAQNPLTEDDTYTYPFDQLVDAHRYMESGHKTGNVVGV